MQIKNKKGIFFILDIVFGLFILIAGLLVLVLFYYQVPPTAQFQTYTSDIALFFSATKVGSVTNQVIREYINSSILQEDEFFSEAFSRFCYENKEDEFFQVVNETVFNFIPSHFNFQLSIKYLNEDSCLSIEQGSLDALESSAVVSTNRILVFGRDGSFNMIGPYILEVKVW